MLWQALRRRRLLLQTVRGSGKAGCNIALMSTMLAVVFLAATLGDDLAYAQKRGFGGGGFSRGGFGGGGFGGFRQAPIFRPPPPTFRPRPPVFRPPPVAPRISAPRPLPRPALPAPHKGAGSQSIPKLGGGGPQVPQAMAPSSRGVASSSRLGQARRSAGNRVIQVKGKNYRIPQRGVSASAKLAANGSNTGKTGCRASIGGTPQARAVTVSLIIQTADSGGGQGGCGGSPANQKRISNLTAVFNQRSKRSLSHLPGPNLRQYAGMDYDPSTTFLGPKGKINYRNTKLEQDTRYFLYHMTNKATGAKVRFLTKKLYTSEEEFYRECAVSPEDFGVKNKVSIFNVPKGTWVSEGKAAPYKNKAGSSAPGKVYEGGGDQVVIQNLARRDKVRTQEAWKKKPVVAKGSDSEGSSHEGSTDNYSDGRSPAHALGELGDKVNPRFNEASHGSRGGIRDKGANSTGDINPEHKPDIEQKGESRNPNLVPRPSR